MKRFFVSIMMLFFSYGSLNAFPDEPDDALIAEIVANDYSCVLGYSEERIYLNPEKIIPSNQGLFLNLKDQEYVVLPMLYSDEYGCYITPTIKVKPDCPDCKKPYLVKCRNDECPGKQKIKDFNDDKKKKKEDYKQKQKEEKAKKNEGNKGKK